VPCAFAKPVPASSAAVATEIRKRFVIGYSSSVIIARTDNEAEEAMFRNKAVPCGFLW
jgi:F420-0:gamma-glutamyl ligase-like protein